MISADTIVFPNNIVVLVKDRTKLLDSDLNVVGRPLRNGDPDSSVGVYAGTWNPDERTHEIGHAAPSEPTVQRYVLAVQAFVKDMDEERGLARHSVLSKMIRTMLYRDTALRVGLAALQVPMNGSVESARRWSVGTARFHSNELDGAFLYLSTLEFWLETETM